MSEQMKYLVAELNKAPYNRNYNLISFDALQGDQLLQILSDVLAVIDAKNKIDIREEEAESTVIRILGMLRILKYKPPDEISHNFRQGLVEGHKQVKMKCTVCKIRNVHSKQSQVFRLCHLSFNKTGTYDMLSFFVRYSLKK